MSWVGWLFLCLSRSLACFICFSACDVSYVAPDDHFAQKTSHKWHIWMVWLQCAYDNGVLAHRYVQISIHIPAIDMNKVFHLRKKKKSLKIKEKKEFALKIPIKVSVLLHYGSLWIPLKATRMSFVWCVCIHVTLIVQLLSILNPQTFISQLTFEDWILI